MKPKRWLYLIHRWLGIGMCLLIAMWFFSGLVMMYVGFPQLTVAERLSALPVLRADTLRISPGDLVEGLAPDARIDSLKLTSVRDRPVYQLTTVDGQRRARFADSGEWLGAVSPDDARAAARSFQRGAQSASPVVIEQERLGMDQWTVSGSLDPHRPLYRIAFNDRAATHLYVSSTTGEVVRDATRKERIWNWLGANLHWIYPKALRRHPTVWHWVVVVLSLVGLVAIVTGGIIGFMRLRLRKKYRGRDITPYRGIMKWHHLLGLVSLVFLTTYMFSGLMSMNPWNVFTPKQSYADLRQDYRGDTRKAGSAADFARLRKVLAESNNIKEVEWHWLDGEAIPVAIAGPYDYRAVLPEGEEPGALLERGRRRLRELLPRYAPQATLVDAQWIDEYDLYYYSHHDRWRPMPALRLRFNNPDQSWFYLDAATGELLSHQTRHSRVQRWLYNGLHSLDFTFLIHHRPLWDITIFAFSALGIAMAITSIVVGFRRLTR